MIQTYLIAAGIILFLMIAWIGVQSLWGKVFAENVNDEDVLAERRSCSNCGCTTVCINKSKETEKIII